MQNGSRRPIIGAGKAVTGETVVNKKKTARTQGPVDRSLFRDIGFLFVATCFVLVKLFGYSIEMAALISPVVIAAVFVGVYLFIQVLWLVMRGSDRIAAALNIKRSPLA